MTHTSFTTRLPADLVRQLDEQAQREGRPSRNNMIEWAIREYLREHKAEGPKED